MHTIVQILADSAYTEKELKAYFDSRYTYYTMQTIPADEEEGTPASNTYYYGNTQKMEDATLAITLIDNTAVTYTNPTNVPEEVEIVSFDDMTPSEVVGTFMGADMDELLEDYEGAFMEMNGMYIASAGDNEYFTGFALMVADGTVVSITIFFDDGLEEEVILDYYREQGYNIQKTGEVDEEGFETYLITKDNITITYSSYMATITAVGAVED